MPKQLASAERIRFGVWLKGQKRVKVICK